MNDSGAVKPQLTPEGKFALLLILAVVVIFIPFLVIGQPEVGLYTTVLIVFTMIAVRVTWKAHRHVWYWVAIAISVPIQVPFVLHAPWANRAFRGTALVPFGIVDFLIVWGVIKIMEKLMTRPK